MKVLVTASQFPDIDGVSCALAYECWLKAKDPKNEYVAAFGGGLHAEPGFVCKKLGIKPLILQESDNFDKFVLLDASEPKGLPKNVRGKDVIEVIDHRMFADYAAFPDAEFRVEPVGAAATQVAEFFYFDQTIPLPPELAALLLCGIYSNTVNFQADTTTFRDIRMRGWLESNIPKKYKNLPRQMYDFKSAHALESLEEILRDDAKDNCEFGLDEPVVMFQIETARADELLKRQGEILKVMRKLFSDRNHHILLIQDAKNGQTFIVSDSEPAMTTIGKTSLQLQKTESPVRIRIPVVTMRKSIQQAVLAAK